MWRIIIALTLITAPALWAQTPESKTDEAAVRALIDRYVNARDRARRKGYRGALHRRRRPVHDGRRVAARDDQAVVTGTAESTKQNPGDRSIDVQALRFVSPDVAIADGWYNIAGSAQKRWTTMVFRREAGTWRIAAVRNMTPTGAPPPRASRRCTVSSSS
jgi:hypothetical protein